MALASSGGYCGRSVGPALSLGTMMEEDRCRSPILGRSALDRREDGLEECSVEGWSDSEELEFKDEEELDIVEDRLGRCVVGTG